MQLKPGVAFWVNPSASHCKRCIEICNAGCQEDVLFRVHNVHHHTAYGIPEKQKAVRKEVENKKIN